MTRADQQKFEQALHCAISWHARQVRKGTAVPYAAHLLGVASLVLEDGGTVTEAIAALLHDAVEDQGGAPRLAEIRRRFGPRVAAIVRGCTDTDQAPKPPWHPRKEEYLRHLEHASRAVLRVSLADKVHNARAIVADASRVGSAVWARFSAPRRDVLWYYRALARRFNRRFPGALASELRRCTQAMAKVPSAH